MARKVLVSMTDDLDGETLATETVEFSPDGRTQYEIDLSEDNARDFDRPSLVTSPLRAK